MAQLSSCESGLSPAMRQSLHDVFVASEPRRMLPFVQGAEKELDECDLAAEMREKMSLSGHSLPLCSADMAKLCGVEALRRQQEGLEAWRRAETTMCPLQLTSLSRRPPNPTKAQVAAAAGTPGPPGAMRHAHAPWRYDGYLPFFDHEAVKAGLQPIDAHEMRTGIVYHGRCLALMPLRIEPAFRVFNQVRLLTACVTGGRPVLVQFDHLFATNNGDVQEELASLFFSQTFYVPEPYMEADQAFCREQDSAIVPKVRVTGVDGIVVHLPETEFATRALGNKLFGAGEFAMSIAAYTRTLNHPDLDDDERAVVLSNRSLAYSTLFMSEHAIEDARAALKIKPDYGSAKARLATAFMVHPTLASLPQEIKAIIEERPDDVILQARKAWMGLMSKPIPALPDLSTITRATANGSIRLPAQMAGVPEIEELHVASLASPRLKHQALDMSLAKIKACGEIGNGLFPSRDVAAGGLILREAPLAFVPATFSLFITDQMGRFGPKASPFAGLKGLVDVLRGNPAVARAVYALAGGMPGEAEREFLCPLVDIENVVDEHGRVIIDLPLLAKIMSLNAFGADSEKELILFQRASFINHSCDPNAAHTEHPGTGVIEVTALRPIAASEEVTISYGADTKAWFDKCLCKVCTDQAAAATDDPKTDVKKNKNKNKNKKNKNKNKNKRK